MTLEVSECPHCRTQVVVKAEGTCPACGKDTRRMPASEADSGGSRAEAWDKYQESLRPTAQLQ